MHDEARPTCAGQRQRCEPRAERGARAAARAVPVCYRRCRDAAAGPRRSAHIGTRICGAEARSRSAAGAADHRAGRDHGQGVGLRSMAGSRKYKQQRAWNHAQATLAAMASRAGSCAPMAISLAWTPTRFLATGRRWRACDCNVRILPVCLCVLHTRFHVTLARRHWRGGKGAESKDPWLGMQHTRTQRRGERTLRATASPAPRPSRPYVYTQVRATTGAVERAGCRASTAAKT